MYVCMCVFVELLFKIYRKFKRNSVALFALILEQKDICF